MCMLRLSRLDFGQSFVGMPRLFTDRRLGKKKKNDLENREKNCRVKLVLTWWKVLGLSSVSSESYGFIVSCTRYEIFN